MGDEQIEPRLTTYDLRVLALVPPMWLEGEVLNPECPRSIWQIGEALQILDLEGELTRELRGLEHLGYVTECAGSRWERIEKGDRALQDTGRQASRRERETA